MGLGKTLQTIALIASLLDGKVKPPFRMNGFQNSFVSLECSYLPVIIAPLSVVGNWMDEFKTFAPSIICLKYIGSQDAREACRSSIIDFIRQQPKKNQVTNNLN